jgi:hypothetical protein
MTHYEALLHELAAHGRTTYPALLKRYPKAQGYSHDGFVHAAWKGRREGTVVPVNGPGSGDGSIVAMGACPCCGQKLKGC